MFKKYYIKSKFRFTMFIMLMVFIMVMSLSAMFNGSYADDITGKAYYAITVESGDTLWEIAARYCNDNSDIRKMVYDISKINDLDNSCLYIGQQLLIPA